MEKAGAVPPASPITEVALAPAPTHDFWIFPVPPWTRWNPESPHTFGMALRVVSILTAMISEFDFHNHIAAVNGFLYVVASQI